MPRYRPLAERILEKVRLTESCWFYDGSHDDKGYAVAHKERCNSGTVRVHRWMYEQFVGPIPEGWEPDHLCRQRGCINPEHLEAVTHHENLLRGDTLTARYKGRTHCDQGHEYTEANTRWRKRADTKARICRKCASIRQVIVNRRKRNAAKIGS